MGIGTCERCKRYGDHEPWCKKQSLSESKLSDLLDLIKTYQDKHQTIVNLELYDDGSGNIGHEPFCDNEREYLLEWPDHKGLLKFLG